jgi:hypothetical protein
MEEGCTRASSAGRRGRRGGQSAAEALMPGFVVTPHLDRDKRAAHRAHVRRPRSTSASLGLDEPQLEDRTNLRWFRFLLAFVLGTSMWFLAGYVGWTDDRTWQHLLPSWLRAVLSGVVWGVGMSLYFGWTDRRANRQ